MEQSIKSKVERIGKPLKDWNISINYGIKTGFNEAFIIDSETKEKLIKKSPKSAEVIRPILRGRDIKRYRADFADLWIIATFPSRNYNIDDYPAVKEHLLSFGYDRLKQTGDSGARKKTNNQWFETQDSISYWDDFSKQKIVWGEISDKSKFALDNCGLYPEATTFFLIGEKLSYLLAILNSKLGEWLFNQIGTTTGMGTNRWKKYKLETLLVKIPSQQEESKINQLIEEISNNDAYMKNGINEVNQLIYRMYNLTPEEISFIEGL
jgi:hypothetical protein